MTGCSPGPRLQECQHGCGKHLAGTISVVFRFISGNLARGEVRAALVGLGQGCRRGSFGPRTGPALSGGDGGRGGQWPWEQDHKELQPLQPTGQ